MVSMRLPTVDEAFQYSPLTSIIPFSTVILTTPAPAQSLPISTEEKDGGSQSSVHFLETLETELARGNEPSSKVKDALQDVQRLLENEQGTIYKFKRPTVFSASAAVTNGAEPVPSTPIISRFAEMVLTSVRAPHSFATLDKTLQKRENLNGVAAAQKGSTPRKVQSTTSSVSVVIPGISGPSQTGDPEAENGATKSESPPKKRKREESDVHDFPYATGVDEQKKSDEAVTSLSTFIIDLLEANDEIKSDPLNAMGGQGFQYFGFNNTPEGNVLMFLPAVHSRLESSIRKVAAVGRLSSIPAESLVRIQKLCCIAVTLATEQGLKVGDDWIESDVEDWAQRLQSVYDGVQASRILLRIMAAGREEKKLFSEDMFQSCIALVTHVINACIIPLIETRPGGADQATFGTYTSEKKQLSVLLQGASNALRIIGDLVAELPIADTYISTVESLCLALLFVENAAIEKESILGIQKCESIRQRAMDVIVRIFTRYPGQRSSIITEILSSLERLPVTRQTARQFKLPEGPAIQLVSALIMRLVQTSAASSSHQRLDLTDKNEDGEDVEEPPNQEDITNGINGQTNGNAEGIENGGIMKSDNALSRLQSLAEPLSKAAQQSALQLIGYMVERAITSTKSGDQPYRNLLDIFTEDFLNVLGTTDWPASELLLRALLSNLMSRMRADNCPAQVKVLGLDLMGTMGSKILDLRLSVRSITRNSELGDSSIAQKLAKLADATLEDRLDSSELLFFDGPYRILLEYLESKDTGDSFPLISARGYLLCQWAKVLWTAQPGDGDEAKAAQNAQELSAQKLTEIFRDPNWSDAERTFQRISTLEGRLAAGIVVLNTQFARSLTSIFHVLLNSMNSEQARLRSTGIRSVEHLLEKDPSILDRNEAVLRAIINLLSDQSSLVRDSALNLLGKCLVLRPSLDETLIDRVITRTGDGTTGVRKRAIKLLKDLYLRNSDLQMRSSISESLLQRVQDADESTADLARQTIEDVWIVPFHSITSKSANAAEAKVKLYVLVSLIVRTANIVEDVLPVLESLIASIVSTKANNSAANRSVCERLVALMIDAVIDSSEIPDAPSQRDILQTLTVFARACPELFTSKQAELLQPYIQNLTNEDLPIYRAVLIIFRHTLPHLQTLNENFLKNVQQALLQSLSKLRQAELNEAIECLWTINGVLKNPDRLVRVMLSCMVGIHNNREANLQESASKPHRETLRYIPLAGYLGKVCDFEQFADTFRSKFPQWKGKSVIGLAVDIIKPFANPQQPAAVREVALQSLCMIGQSWPKQFDRNDVRKALELALKSKNEQFEHIILQGFRNFFKSEERKSESGADVPVGEGALKASERLGKSFVANESDGIANSVAQIFLPQVVDIALGTLSEISLTATHVIASVSRQGLVHPKQCAAPLVALETSPLAAVATAAFEEHRDLHTKRESILEKEYPKAVRQAFEYQRDIVGDARGATTNPAASKLHLLFDIIRTGKGKLRLSFLVNLCSNVRFELAQLGSTETATAHLHFARFCLENLAFFEYPRTDELITLLELMEKIFAELGSSLVQQIDSDVLKIRLEASIEEKPKKEEEPAPPSSPDMLFDYTSMAGAALLGASVELDADEEDSIHPPSEKEMEVDHEHLLFLTTISMILTLLYETRTFLRRLWGLSKYTSSKPNKAAGKDLSKAPVRVAFVQSDKYLDRTQQIMASVESVEKMTAQCKAFSDLMNVDTDVKVEGATEAEDPFGRTGGFATPSDGSRSRSGSIMDGSGTAKGRKRKVSGTGASLLHGTPTKRKKARTPSSAGKPSAGFIEFEDD